MDKIVKINKTIKPVKTVILISKLLLNLIYFK